MYHHRPSSSEFSSFFFTAPTPKKNSVLPLWDLHRDLPFHMAILRAFSFHCTSGSSSSSLGGVTLISTMLSVQNILSCRIFPRQLSFNDGSRSGYLFSTENNIPSTLIDNFFRSSILLQKILAVYFFTLIIPFSA